MEDAPALADGYPRAFGSYVLLTAFAQGGMGEVYLAKTGGIEGIERICVLKKLRPDFGSNQEYVNRFLDEARLVVQLNHANIAHVFDVGRVGSEYYLAMEYVSGVSLKGLMSRAFESGAPPGQCQAGPQIRRQQLGNLRWELIERQPHQPPLHVRGNRTGLFVERYDAPGMHAAAAAASPAVPHRSPVPFRPLGSLATAHGPSMSCKREPASGSSGCGCSDQRDVRALLPGHPCCRSLTLPRTARQASRSPLPGSAGRRPARLAWCSDIRIPAHERN